jgi:hypothetical protein
MNLSERIADDVLRASGSGLRHYTIPANREAIIAAASVVDELANTLWDTLPKNVCLTNANVRDETVIPIDLTMGDLRRIAAVLAEAGL